MASPRRAAAPLRRRRPALDHARTHAAPQHRGTRNARSTPPARLLALLASAAFLAPVACGGGDDGVTAAGIAVSISATGLEVGTQMRWAATMHDSFGDLVDEATLDARASRTGEAKLSWRARCLPTVNKVVVDLDLLGLFGADGAALAPDRWVDPTAAASFSLAARCPVVGDEPVAIEVPFARPAATGFFDSAIAFDGVACAALLKCADMPSPVLSALGEALAEGDPGAVLDFTCVGPNGALPGGLYLDDVVLSCGASDPSPATVDTGALGLLSPGEGLRDAENRLLAASVSRESVPSLGIARWWVTVGLDPSTIASDCTLSARASASASPFPGGVETPAGAAWPLFAWDVPVTSAATGRICTEHAATATGTDVGVAAVSPAATRVFHHGWNPTSGAMANRCDPAHCADHADCLDGRCQCDVGWVGDGEQRCDPVGIFVTRDRYDAGLGGLAGADARCSAIAADLGFPGRWAAILSDSTASAASRLAVLGPLLNAKGELVAQNEVELWRATLAHAVRYDQTGSAVVVGDVWTGTDEDGSRDGVPDATDPYVFCNDWRCPDRYRRVGFIYTGAGCGAGSWPDADASCEGTSPGLSSVVTVTARNAAGQTLFLREGMRALDPIDLDPATLSTVFGCHIVLTVSDGSGAVVQTVRFSTSHAATFGVGHALGAFRVDDALTQADPRLGVEAGTSDAASGWLARWGPAPGRLSCSGEAHLFCVMVQ